MADILEKFDSREATVSPENPVRTLRYAVTGTEDDLVVQALVEATIPALYDGHIFQTYRTTHVGGGVWEVEARYGKKEPKEAGDSTFSFDTTGGTAKRQQSLGTLSFVKLGSPTNPADFKGAINVHDGKAEGVDIVIPKFAFTITRVLAHPLSGSYVQALYEKTGKVNSDIVVLVVSGVVLTFQPGELLFEGATGTQRGQDDWEITLKCAASRNETGLAFGDVTSVDKKGWHYLWVSYEDAEDTNAHVLIKNPKQVNVEQVYEETILSIIFA